MLETKVHLYDVSIVAAMEAALREGLTPYCKTCVEPSNKVQSIELYDFMQL